MISKWVATWSGKNDDGSPATIHVEGTKADMDALLSVTPKGEVWDMVLKAATWECDGRDNCRVDA